MSSAGQYDSTANLNNVHDPLIVVGLARHPAPSAPTTSTILAATLNFGGGTYTLTLMARSTDSPTPREIGYQYRQYHRYQLLQESRPATPHRDPGLSIIMATHASSRHD
ncbi:hypothetical protein H9P43_010123 [Blastocladiella emersonii ATCC 22665]|nr:hypothetical protein H9P43_010123 [Blastocladiella emersonii ATCC 22665]